MERIVTKIVPTVVEMPRRKRTAAYARVSLGTEHMLHSLAAQVSYYSGLIQKNGEWEYAGVYADADETGTKENRPEFQRMLADCRAGLIDSVITKAISRFARNTVTLLETVRELKDLGIDIFFEEQNIHTLSSEGELMLTILASYAQEESRSVSENIKWRKRNDMKSGKAKVKSCFGYASEGGKLVIKPDEAEIVRLMFDLYLDGMGHANIARRLNELGCPSPIGGKWYPSAVDRTLHNDKVCGNILHQQRYVVDHLSKTVLWNKGELPMYRIEDAHEGIVSKETFDAVKAETARRAVLKGTVKEYETFVFKSKIKCCICGHIYWRTYNGSKWWKHRAWKCSGKQKNGGSCHSHEIAEEDLVKITNEVLGLDAFDGEVFKEKVERINVLEGRTLAYIFYDGSIVSRQWKVHRNGRNKAKFAERRENYAECTSDPGEKS